MAQAAALPGLSDLARRSAVSNTMAAPVNRQRQSGRRPIHPRFRAPRFTVRSCLQNLLGPVRISPRYEFLYDGFSELNAGRIVDLKMNPCPYARISGFFSDCPDKVGPC